MPKKGKAAAPPTPARAQAQPQPGPSGTQGKKKKSAPKQQEGCVRLRRTELLTTFKLPANKASAVGRVPISVENLPYLKRFGALFERYSVFMVKFTFRTACPSTQGGRIMMGFDYASLFDKDLDRTKISQLSPSISQVVWRDFSFNLAPSHLMSRKYYSIGGEADKADRQIGILHYSLDLSASQNVEVTVGEVWIEYSVCLMDPRPE